MPAASGFDDAFEPGPAPGGLPPPSAAAFEAAFETEPQPTAASSAAGFGDDDFSGGQRYCSLSAMTAGCSLNASPPPPPQQATPMPPPTTTKRKMRKWSMPNMRTARPEQRRRHPHRRRPRLPRRKSGRRNSLRSSSRRRRSDCARSRRSRASRAAKASSARRRTRTRPRSRLLATSPLPKSNPFEHGEASSAAQPICSFNLSRARHQRGRE